MTGEVVNLRRERKRRARDTAAMEAAANRAAFGIAKADKTLAEAERRLFDRRLSGHAIAAAPPPDDA